MKMLTSPDALPDRLLSEGHFATAFRSRGCKTFREAAELVRTLPYARTTNPLDYELVLVERRGTCSTKHALLAALAREESITIKLMLGIYEMMESNTPGVGPVLLSKSLSSIPEAHC